ncbi:MAG TPA: hypothetical protein DEG10_14125 [Leclercia adecarboxylata]|nr:hypothetical protein [Leclercia adecarboxylata]
MLNGVHSTCASLKLTGSISIPARPQRAPARTKNTHKYVVTKMVFFKNYCPSRPRIGLMVDQARHDGQCQ